MKVSNVTKRKLKSKTIIKFLNPSNTKVSFAEILTDKGHDAFLLDEPKMSHKKAGTDFSRGIFIVFIGSFFFCLIVDLFLQRNRLFI